MATTTYDYIELDTASKILVLCTDQDAAAIDLTSCTVRLYWRRTPGGRTPAPRTMSITDAAAGKADYQFQENELNPGTYTFQVSIEDASGYIKTSTNTITALVGGRIWED